MFSKELVSFNFMSAVLHLFSFQWSSFISTFPLPKGGQERTVEVAFETWRSAPQECRSAQRHSQCGGICYPWVLEAGQQPGKEKPGKADRMGLEPDDLERSHLKEQHIWL